MRKVLHIDENHPILGDILSQHGFHNDYGYEQSKSEILEKLDQYEGLIVRSRFPIDAKFLEAAQNLKFIGRVGAGLENIDLETADRLGIKYYNAPEGNRNAVGEHALGLLLAVLNKIVAAHNQVTSGLWLREQNRGMELDSQTVGIIGYGNMGKSFARKLSGFNCEVLCYDIQENLGDLFAEQVSLEELKHKATVISLHTPQTPLTINMIDTSFINKMRNHFYLLNTARGKIVDTDSLVAGIENGKILGAGLDVLEYESSSFTAFYENDSMPDSLKKLMQFKNVVLTPHVAGWTVESKKLLAITVAKKIIENHT